MWIEERDGKFRFFERYTDPLTLKVKKVSVTLDKNTAASRKLALDELNRKIEKLTTVVKYENVTFKELYDKYTSYQRKICKPSTCNRNELTVSKIIRILGEDVIVDNINAAYVNEHLLNETENPTTLNEYLKRLKAMLNWGYQNDYINNIVLITKLKNFKDVPHKKKIEDKYLEPEEVTLLLDSMKYCPQWYYVTKFQLLSGLRFGEIAALEEKDIGKQYISVTKTYDMINECVTTPKTMCSEREVFIQDELAALIKKIKLYEKEQRMQTGIRSKLLFCDDEGKHISYVAYNKYLKTKCKKLFDKKVTTHTLRHTHASMLLAEGVSVDTISRRLGHEDSRITKEIYLHVMKKIKEKDNLSIKNVKLVQ